MKKLPSTPSPSGVPLPLRQEIGVMSKSCCHHEFLQIYCFCIAIFHSKISHRNIDDMIYVKVNVQNTNGAIILDALCSCEITEPFQQPLPFTETWHVTHAIRTLQRSANYSKNSHVCTWHHIETDLKICMSHLSFAWHFSQVCFCSTQ